MAYDFNAEEIFEMAEQIERNGADFYRRAAEGVADQDAKNMLTKLANMEDSHEQRFKNMRGELGDKEKMSTVFDPEGDVEKYLKSLADTKVFFEKTIDTGNLVEILKEALIAEKDSIVFYLGMMELVPEKKGKDRIHDIIREEMGHITVISRELKKAG